MPDHASSLSFLLAFAAACSSTQGSPSDAGVTGDSGLSNVPYWQWYYPDCGAPGVCDNPGCKTVQLEVGPVGACGSSGNEVTTGCVPPHTVQDDYVYTTSEHQIIITEDGPYTLDGLTTCVSDGTVVGDGKCCTWLDGGGPTLFPP